MSDNQAYVDPKDQFQVGERVLFRPAGVKTTVTGYIWSQDVDTPPHILAYDLACGIAVSKEHLSKLSNVCTDFTVERKGRLVVIPCMAYATYDGTVVAHIINSALRDQRDGWIVTAEVIPDQPEEG